MFHDAFPGKTLLQVLSQGGGDLQALGRQTVAALLNARSSGVNYALSNQQVIYLFDNPHPASKSEYNALKNYFEGFNHQGCPLN